MIAGRSVKVVMGVSLVLAAGSGAIVAVAIGQTPPAPQKTVTVNIPTGATGPQGPPGPAGPQGPPGASAFDCPAGFVPGELGLNHPGGQVTTYGCLK